MKLLLLHLAYIVRLIHYLFPVAGLLSIVVHDLMWRRRNK